jgi:osmoprotectant transport system permease protein
VIGPLVEWDWLAEHIGLIQQRLMEHIVLTLIAVLLGFVISFPVALYAYRHRWLYPPVTYVSAILFTIPSLALMLLLIPLTGLTLITAEIALVSYTLLILIRNTVAGLDGVPSDTREAARGMGFSDAQILWRVELPLAVPVIAAGIRVATVTTVGLTTVTALIGYGGLGYFIFTGLQQFFSTEILLGSVLSALLAIVFDFGLLFTERRLTPWRVETEQLGGDQVFKAPV